MNENNRKLPLVSAVWKLVCLMKENRKINMRPGTFIWNLRVDIFT